MTNSVTQKEKLISMPAKTITNGNLEELSSVTIDSSLLPEQFLSHELVLFITDSSQYIVDCSRSDILRGRYIIQLDGKYSLNKLEQLSGNNLMLKVLDVPLIFDRSKVKIIGKVIASINSEY